MMTTPKTFNRRLTQGVQPIAGGSERIEYREPILGPSGYSSLTPLGAVTYTNQHGVEVAIVYLSDLCELE